MGRALPTYALGLTLADGSLIFLFDLRYCPLAESLASLFHSVFSSDLPVRLVFDYMRR